MATLFQGQENNISDLDVMLPKKAHSDRRQNHGPLVSALQSAHTVR